MEFVFDKASRKEIVRDILAAFQEKVDASNTVILASYESMDYLKDGFGFKFKIYIGGPDSEKKDKADDFFKIKDYLGNIFGYLFNGQLSVASWVDENNFEAEYEIVSEI